MRISRAAIFLTTTAMMAATPALAEDVVPPKVNVATPAGVNLSDGYFQLSATDLAIGTLELERFTLPPAKLAVNDPYFGAGITHNFDIYVATGFSKAMPQPYPRPAEYHPVVHLGAGTSGVYLQSGTASTTVAPLNVEAEKGILAYSSGTYTYTDSSGTIYTFNPSVHAGGASGATSQRIDNILYPNGRRESYSYNGSGQLKMVSDTAGYAIIFDYNTDGDVSAACSFDLARDYVTASSTCTSATNKVTYAYTSKLLTSVTNVLSQVTSYNHSTTIGYGYPITCVTPPGYSSCKVTNAASSGKVYEQVLADGAVWDLAFDVICTPDPDVPETANGGCLVDLTDPNSKVSHFSFYNSSPVSITDANGKTTTYQWMGAPLGEPLEYDQTPNGSFLVEADYPEGDKYLADYDGNFHAISRATRVAKPGSGLANLVETWGYSTGCTSPATLQNCAKPIWKKDARNNQTDYAYYGWGGLQWEMPPAPTSGAARPLKLYDFVQKYAYIKNSGGTLVAAASPIWVPNSETDCQTVVGSSTPTCDTGAQVTVTTYEYGATGVADDLLLRGKVVTTGGVSLRSCYGYDAQSNKIWETSPRGTTSTSCS